MLAPQFFIVLMKDQSCLFQVCFVEERSNVWALGGPNLVELHCREGRL